VQTCSRCNASSPDTASECSHCRANLTEYSTTAVTLRRLQSNPRVSAVRVSVTYDACSYCYELLSTYPKESVPSLPHPGCSHELGCRCFYEPILADTYPLPVSKN
jgi:hypothetical protein